MDDKRTKKWRCRFIMNYKTVSLERFKEEVHAARRRDLYIIDNHMNEHYKMNFEWTEDDIKFLKNKLNLN